MNLSKPFILRPVMTTLIMFAIILGGIMGYQLLPVSDLPNVDYPVIRVQAMLPGASPNVIAETVATPLEKEFMTIPGVTVVKSENRAGFTQLHLEFKPDKKMDAAAQDVEAAISRAMNFLPSTMQNKPTYFKENPSQEPIMFLALTSPAMTLPDLYDYGHSVIGKRISMIDGVAHMQVHGPERQIEIHLDPGAMQVKEVTVGEVKQALLQANPHLPSGVLTGKTQTISIHTEGRLKTAEAYETLIIKDTQEGFIRLDDIADVIDGPDPDMSYFRYIAKGKNQPTVILAVHRLPNANTVKVSQAIHELLPRLEEELPHSISVVPIFEKASSIEESIFDVELTLIIALLLVILTIYFYFGRAKDTLIPSLVLPISVIGTFGIIYLLGFSLNNLSLLALTLALGFVVDDAIVVIENIIRNIEQGQSPFKAAVEGSKQISFTVLSMTLSLTASFIPLLFMRGTVGIVFREFAITLALAVLISGFVSLTLTPMLASRLLSQKDTEQKTKVSKIGDAFNRYSLRLYEKALIIVLRYSKITALCGLLCVGGSVWLFKSLPLDFLPHNTIDYAFVGTQGPQGIAPKHLIKYKKTVDNILNDDPSVTDFISWTWQDFGQSFVRLDPKKEDPTNRLQEKLSKIPGVFTFVSKVPLLSLNLGGGSDGRLQYQLRSAEYDELVKVTQNLTEKIRQIPGLLNVKHDLEINRPQVKLEIQRERAALLGISAEEIEMALLNAYANTSITTIETAKGKIQIVLGVRESAQRDVDALEKLTLVSPKTGETIPLSTLTKWSEEAGPNVIHHLNQFPSASIGFTLGPENSMQNTVEEINKLAESTLPPSTIGKFEGAAKAFEETFGDIGFLVLITFLASYIILGILYESFIHPITILSTLPPAAIGGLLSLYIFGLPLSLFSLIGLILLVGIVKKNGIMMVDHAMELRKSSDTPAHQAILEACLVRFRPMMMTTFAAIMGALPIALGVGSSGDMRTPLGLVIVGGLLISQMITLFITPAFYVCLDKLQKTQQMEHQ